ncbi:SAVED domain-containing protein [Nocardia goodfellowii]
MTLPARAAALRGDDYQHVVALFHACRVLTEEHIDSVSIEDAAGGAFDDVVVRMRPSAALPHEYIQVKSSNYNNVVVDEQWLLKAKTAKGKSPLQHFYRTWCELTAAGESFVLKLLSNRNYDHNDPLLGLIDNTTEKIPRIKVDTYTPRSNPGLALQHWADHLGINLNELKIFLTEVWFIHGESDASWEDRCRPLMQKAGLRDDDDALTVGKAMVRGWVTSGKGRRTRDDIRAEVTQKRLLAREGTLVLAVHAIDNAPLPDLPNATIDIVDQYPDIDPFQRRQLRDPNRWHDVVVPKLIAAKADLGTFRSRKVHVVGAMRLPMYFAVGRTLPDVAGWILSVDQRGIEWSTAARREDAALDILHSEEISNNGDLAVAIALAQDPTAEVRAFLTESGTQVKRFLVLSTPGGPSRTAVPGPGWAADWVSRARDLIRLAVRESNASRVHLFISSPAGAALFLGHQWNMIPATTVYEHQDPGYEPTMTFPG